MRGALASAGFALGLALAAGALLDCTSLREIDAVDAAVPIDAERDLALAREPFFARLDEEDGEDFEALRIAFAARNPGYDIGWCAGLTELRATQPTTVVFVQGGTSVVEVGDAREELRAGDVVLVRHGERMLAAAPLDVLLFSVPVELPAALPTFVRPDHDPRITDTPGGCAEEQDAYRRILLTWRPDVGPYVFRALNAHRVRIFDSFTHYHPPHGGFDEFYLVQGVRPGAKLITSSRTARIVEPDGVAESELETLLVEHELREGDLVYLPRGTIHRGVGGVLTQVITVPGFRPGAEIGVDHFLARLNRRFPERAPLPLHAKGADAPMVK